MNAEMRRRRRALDITQAALGSEVGLSRQAVVAIERGGNPSLRHAMAIARRLGGGTAEVFPEVDAQAGRDLDEIGRRAARHAVDPTNTTEDT